MAELLPSTRHIVARIEDAIAQAREFVYILSPNICSLQGQMPSNLAEVVRLGAKVVLIYRNTSIAHESIETWQASRTSLFHNANINTSILLTEKEAVISSFNPFVDPVPDVIEFGTYFRKAYAAEMHAHLLQEFRKIWSDSVRMVFHENTLISQEAWVASMPKEPEVKAVKPGDPVLMSTKRLTVKEKQDVVLKVFKREHPDCTIKVEDAERIRIYGRGMVLSLSNERVDLIFVHYETYQARTEEVKSFITARHPDLKFWFQYNRINMQLQYEKEINDVFFTVRECVSAFALA